MQAIKLAAFRVFESIPDAPAAIRRRRKRASSPESEAAKLKRTILTNFQKLCDLESKMSGNERAAWLALRKQMNAIAGISEDSPQATEAQELDPTGSQIDDPSRGDADPSPRPSSDSTIKNKEVLSAFGGSHVRAANGVEEVFYSPRDDVDELARVPKFGRALRAIRAERVRSSSARPSMLGSRMTPRSPPGFHSRSLCESNVLSAS
jgi:hypothetical protein